MTDGDWFFGVVTAVAIGLIAVVLYIAISAHSDCYKWAEQKGGQKVWFRDVGCAALMPDGRLKVRAYED